MTSFDPTNALETLCAGAIRGPAAPAWELFDCAWPLITRRMTTFMRSLGVPRELWDDCGQISLLRAWRSRQNYRGASADEWYAWLYRICQREFQRLLSTKDRVPKPATGLGAADEDLDSGARVLEERDARDDTTETVLARDERRALEDCLEVLPVEHKSVVELLYAASPTTEREAASTLGISKSYVNVLRQASLRALGDCLRGKGVD